MTTGYMDLAVEMVNLYNLCDLDYYMMAFAPPLTALSGFLSFLVSALEIVFSEDEVPIYVGISKAAFDRDQAQMGNYFGKWFGHLFPIELQDT